MNRYLLQSLARERIKDAEALLAAGRWSGAYYLSGYAVECALKACFAKATREYDFPDKEKAPKVFTHDFQKLLDLADLRQERDNDMKRNSGIQMNWAIVHLWNENSRYQPWTEKQAKDLYTAVTHSTEGLIAWIMNHW